MLSIFLLDRILIMLSPSVQYSEPSSSEPSSSEPALCLQATTIKLVSWQHNQLQWIFWGGFYKVQNFRNPHTYTQATHAGSLHSSSVYKGGKEVATRYVTQGGLHSQESLLRRTLGCQLVSGQSGFGLGSPEATFSGWWLVMVDSLFELICAQAWSHEDGATSASTATNCVTQHSV